jgi:hypothetical protein
MTGSIRIDDTQLSEQLDTLIRDFIQRSVFRGAVKVKNVSRGCHEWQKPDKTIKQIPYYDVSFEGVLDLLAGPNENDKV